MNAAASHKEEQDEGVNREEEYQRARTREENYRVPEWRESRPDSRRSSLLSVLRRGR